MGESAGDLADTLERVVGVDAVHAVEQLLAGHGQAGPVQTELPHGVVETVAADESVEHVGGGVVADDDHEGREVADGRAEAGGELLEHAAAGRTVGVGQLESIGGVDDAHVDLAVELDEYGNLEGAGGEV